MYETQKLTKELVADMLSGDSHRLWHASCEICSLSQNHSRVMEVARYRYRIKFATRRILSGCPYSTQRKRLLKIFKIIDFHKKNKGYPCCLLDLDDNPHHVVEDGYFDLLQTVPYIDRNYNNYYLVRCKRCGSIYKVREEEYHLLWWDWQWLEVHGDIDDWLKEHL